jgi:hypothetical protein
MGSAAVLLIAQRPDQPDFFAAQEAVHSSHY